LPPPINPQCRTELGGVTGVENLKQRSFPAADEGMSEAGLKRVSSIRPDTVLSYERAVGRSIAAMRERMEEDLSLKDLAGEAFISLFHFNRIFRQLVGIPPCQFLGALRLQEAKRLLLTTDASVTDICFQVGYNSLGTFTRRFTSLVGTSPRHLRALARRRSPPLSELPPLLTRDFSGPAVRGVVEADNGFRGVTFAGLFESAIPQGCPVACTLAAAPGAFAIPGCPDGNFFLFVAALPLTSDGREQSLGDTVLRGCSRGSMVQVRNGQADLPVAIGLRPAELLDPPLLISLRIVLDRWLAVAGKGGSDFEQSRRSRDEEDSAS
jgi:AraC family transcriptional regulator